MLTLNDIKLFLGEKMSPEILKLRRPLELLKEEKIMGEIVTTAACCFGITLFGLALGFVFLQVQANT